MYFGSVRFFRHLIITVVILVVLLPVFLAVYFGIQCSIVKKELRETQQTVISIDAVEYDELVNELNNLNETISGQLGELQKKLEEFIGGQTPVIEQSFEQSLSDQLDEFQESVTDPIVLQLDMLERQLDESMTVQSTILNDQISSDQINAIEQQLFELVQCQRSIENYMEYIESAVSEYTQEDLNNP